jgi:hypothetical protein
MYVQPSTFLLDEKNKQKKFVRVKELIKDSLESITLFNGNKLFGIALFVPCVITVINKNKIASGIKCIDKINEKQVIYSNINDINKFTDVDIYPSLKAKILNAAKNNSLQDFLNKNIMTSYWVNVAQIRGNVDLNSDKTMLKNDFYTLVMRDLTVSNTKREQRENTQFSFNTELEATNFLNYLKTDFVRFCISIYKNNQNTPNFSIYSYSSSSSSTSSRSFNPTNNIPNVRCRLVDIPLIPNISSLNLLFEILLSLHLPTKCVNKAVELILSFSLLVNS